MKITSLKKHLFNAYSKKIPCMIWGKPGIGKSSIIKQTALELDVDLIDLRLPQLEPTDLRGIPVPNRDTKKTEWFVPEFLPVSGNGILFLDEIEKSSISVKNAALQLILDRRIGSYTLPDGWSIMAAGNHEDDGAFSQQLGSALANRMIHFEISPDFETWIKWARNNDIHENIISYLTFRPDHLYKYENSANAFPTPRSWEAVNTMFKNIDDTTEQNEILEAVVGKSVGYEYRAWLNIYKNVRVDDILYKGKIPDFKKEKDKSLVYAVVMAVSHNIVQKSSAEIKGIETNIAAFLSILNTEMQAVFCRQLPIKKMSVLMEHHAFRKIADKITGIMFGI